MLKKLRLDSTSSGLPFISSGKSNDLQVAGSKRTSVTMEEVEAEDAISRGFAPGGDADYFTEEDDGRFFGGGLTSEQKEILNIFDNATNNEEDVRRS